MIAVDSSVWIALFRNEPSRAVALIKTLDDNSKLLVGDIVLLEVLRGARDDGQAAKIEERMRRFVVRPMLSPGLAAQAAHHYRRLRSYGVTVRKTPDLIIAAYCIANGHALLHQDRDFEPFSRHCGLKVA